MCGVAGVHLFDSSRNDAAQIIHQMLLSQRNRMNYSAGVVAYKHGRINDHLLVGGWGLGPITTAFGAPEQARRRMQELEGNIAIGHGRYATTSSNQQLSDRQKKRMAPPFRYISDRIALQFALGYNGDIINYEELAQSVKGDSDGYHIRTRTDTEIARIIMLRSMHKALETRKVHHLDKEAFKDVFTEFGEKVTGTYSLVFEDGDGNLIIAHDPQGNRPISYCINNEGFFAASETTAFDDLKIDADYHDLPAGHFILVDRNGSVSEPIEFAKPDLGICIFDPQYFSHVTSATHGMVIQEYRREIGAAMAKKMFSQGFNEEDIIAPLPETARAYVNGFVSGLIRQGVRPPEPLEAFIKYLDYRNFMEDDPVNRIEKARRKFRRSKHIAQGKRVWLGDDSTVRGDVFAAMVPIAREELGAQEVHGIIFYDAFRYPCYRGIDVPSLDQLLAARFDGNVERMAKHVGLDSLHFFPIEHSLEVAAKMMGLNATDFCTGCVNQGYPTDLEKRLSDQ